MACDSQARTRDTDNEPLEWGSSDIRHILTGFGKADETVKE
jgi:hypothetical protein